jgi:hypothetical protein
MGHTHSQPLPVGLGIGVVTPVTPESPLPSIFPIEIVPGLTLINMTSTGRVVEEYNTTVLTEPLLVTIVNDQIRDDIKNDAYTPKIVITDSGTFIQNTPLGEIELGPPLYQSSLSAQFHIPPFPNMVIEYRTNCRDLGIVHPAVINLRFSRRAGRYGIAQKPLFVSPPALVEDHERLPSKLTFNCSEGSTMRYTISHRNQRRSLTTIASKYPGNIVPFQYGLKIAMELVSLLDILHNKAGIVHGAINSNYVVFDRHTARLSLERFAHASVYHGGPFEHAKDLIDVLVLFARLVGDNEILDELDELVDGDDFVDPLDALQISEKNKRTIRALLISIARKALILPIINYREISAMLEECLYLSTYE